MQTINQKTRAENFLRMITSGQIEEAYKKYVDLSGRHHNVFTPAGFLALKAGMEENDSKFPDKKLTIKHAVAEGDTVITYSHLVLKPGERGMVVVHVVRFADGKIVELWDCGQSIPENMLNSDGVF